MLIVHIHIHVKTEFLEAFAEATRENARHSVQEPGITQFEALQQADDPTRFRLMETYRDPDAQTRHRGTSHYAKWRDTVTEMMAEPRTPVKYVAI